MITNQHIISIALAGNPNSGKTTMFNLLTGAHQKIGNYPGVTVERREGMIEYRGTTINFVDLPGIYSLSAYSPEERVARRYLTEENPHATVVVVDSTALERSLYFIIQLLELGLKVIIALNMIDEAKNNGIEINIHRLQQLLNVKIVPTIARKKRGRTELLEAVLEAANEPLNDALKVNYGRELEHKIYLMQQQISQNSFLELQYSSRLIAIRYLEKDPELLVQGLVADKVLHQNLLAEAEDANRLTNERYDYSPETIIADKRYGYIAGVLNKNIIQHSLPNQTRRDITAIADRILTAPFTGSIFLIVILYATFWFSITLSEAPINWIQQFFSWLQQQAVSYIPPGMFQNLITDGILGGIGAVLSFVPIISLMFIAVALLEDSGYMARMSYMLDRVFRFFGLHGNSIIAMIVSGGIGAGCAVAGVMATRTLRSNKEKIATIVTAPIMSCGAKLPVFTILCSAFFPLHVTEALFIITISSWIAVFLIAKLLRSTLLKGKSTPFLMELPPYRLPTLKCLILHAWERVWLYIKKAGTVILGVAIVLWAAMTYPGLPNEEQSSLTAQRIEIKQNSALSAQAKLKQLQKLDNQEGELKLENSYAGKIGKALEPVSMLSGFDWRINIALVGGLAAKEVILSTLATALNMGNIDPDSADVLADKLRAENIISKTSAIALIIFTMLYAPCFVTIVVIGREAGIHWAIFSLIFNTVIAFTLSTMFYQLSLYLQGT